MARTVAELTNYLAATFTGDGKLQITGIAAHESASPGDLVYVDSPRFLESAQRCAAVCVIAPREMPIPGKTQIFAAQPKLAFAKAAAWLLPPVRIASSIHATAIVDSSAKLGPGVSLGPYAVIEAGAQIGAGTQIGAHCFVGAGARTGENCRLYPRVTLYAGVQLGHCVILHSGAVIGSDGFGYVFGEGHHWPFPQMGACILGDDVEIGANTTIDRGSLGQTRIGQGTKLDNLVHVAHNVSIGEHTVIAAQTGISGSCTIGKNVMMGGQVGLGDHCEIEDGAVLGGGTGVLNGKIIRAGQVMWGTPARPLKKFKEQYAWFARLPELAARLRRLEEKT